MESQLRNHKKLQKDHKPDLNPLLFDSVLHLDLCCRLMMELTLCQFNSKEKGTIVFTSIYTPYIMCKKENKQVQQVTEQAIQQANLDL